PRCLGLWLLFFFSSRRRHTRFSRDWGSDVCSSDLALPTPVDARIVYEPDPLRSGRMVTLDDGQNITLTPWDGESRLNILLLGIRSEERRVGKECRSWWSR